MLCIYLNFSRMFIYFSTFSLLSIHVCIYLISFVHNNYCCWNAFINETNTSPKGDDLIYKTKIVATGNNNEQFGDNISNLLQTGHLLLQDTASHASENCVTDCMWMSSRRNSSANNRSKPRCNDCFRATKFLCSLAQALASKIDQML